MAATGGGSGAGGGGGGIIGGVDINNLVLFGQHLQLTIKEFSDLTLREIVRSPSFSTIVNTSPTLLDKFQLGFGEDVTTSQAHSVLKDLPSDNACGKGAIMCGILTLISFCMILLRMSSRWMSGGKLRWDDHLCWMAFVFTILVQCAEVVACHHPLVHGGRHFWELTISQYRNNLIFAYALEFTYYPNLCLIKLSILLFYHHLFRAEPRLQTVCKVLCYILLLGNVFPIMGFFQFRPIPHWDHILDAQPAFNRYAYFSSIGYITIITDFIILALPISVLPKVRLQLRDKIILTGIFMIGTFACISSILRLVSLKPYCNSKDWSYASANTAIWAMFELHLAIVCSCVPCLKILATKMGPFMSKHCPVRRGISSTLSIIHTPKGGAGSGSSKERRRRQRQQQRNQDIECGHVNLQHTDTGGLSGVLDDCDAGSKWSKSAIGCRTVSLSSQRGLTDFVNPCAGGPPLPPPTDPSVTRTQQQDPVTMLTFNSSQFTPPTAPAPIATTLKPIDFEAEVARHKLGLARDPNIVVATGILDSLDDHQDLEHELQEMVREVEKMRKPKGGTPISSPTSGAESVPPRSSGSSSGGIDTKANNSFDTERKESDGI